MSYTKNIVYLKKKVPDYTTKSYKWLLENIKIQNNKFQKIIPSKMMIGDFYFMIYDPNAINKSSKMEQFVPMMVVDYKPNIDNKVLWVLNLNFFPLNIKEAFFTVLVDKYYPTTIKNNREKKTVGEESPLPSINYENVYKQLLKYGMDYAIREIRVELIKDIYNVSTDDLHFLTTANTQKLTGVDERKLTEIWLSKLEKETLEDRMDDLNSKSDYETVIKELNEIFKNLNEAMEKFG